MSKKLHYFHLNGLAESIRYILHYAGEEFYDVRYDLKSWPIKEVKEKLPYGQLPLYEEDGKTLNQSLAIARYVAAKAHLVPDSLWDQAVLDAIVFNIYDFWSKTVAYFKEQDPKRKAELKKEILEETAKFFFSRFEKELKDNGGYFHKGKLTWADFILVGIVEASDLLLDAKLEEHYPTIKALIQKITDLPGVKKYIAERKPYSV